MKVSLAKSNFIIPQALHSGAISLSLQDKNNPISDSFFCFVLFFLFYYFTIFNLNRHIKFYRFSGFLPLFCFFLV